jgi:hypothetical protein
MSSLKNSFLQVAEVTSHEIDKIIEQLHAEFMALFRVKLHAADIIFRDDGGKVIAVMGGREGHVLLGALNVVGMNEIKPHILGHPLK